MSTLAVQGAQPELACYLVAAVLSLGGETATTTASSEPAFVNEAVPAKRRRLTRVSRRLVGPRVRCHRP